MSKDRGEKRNLFQSTPDLRLLPYRLLGNRITRILPLFSDLSISLDKARLKVAFHAYVSLMLFFTIVTGASVFILTLTISLLMFATLVLSILLAAVLAILTGVITFLGLYMYPSIVAGSRKRILNEEIPYIASHMAVLSKAGMSPEAIFRSLALTESKQFRSIVVEETRDIVRDVYTLGFDIVSSMERIMRRSTSPEFSRYIDGMIGVTLSGGDLSNYFINAAKGFMDTARIKARALIETLAGIAEVYVSLMIVFPLVTVVMLSVMGVIGGGLGGFSVLSVMYLIVYILLPAFLVVLLVYLDSIMPPK